LPSDDNSGSALGADAAVVSMQIVAAVVAKPDCSALRAVGARDAPQLIATPFAVRVSPAIRAVLSRDPELVPAAGLAVTRIGASLLLHVSLAADLHG
jgi:hypothetical protein